MTRQRRGSPTVARREDAKRRRVTDESSEKCVGTWVCVCESGHAVRHCNEVAVTRDSKVEMWGQYHPENGAPRDTRAMLGSDRVKDADSARMARSDQERLLPRARARSQVDQRVTTGREKAERWNRQGRVCAAARADWPSETLCDIEPSPRIRVGASGGGVPRRRTKAIKEGRSEGNTSLLTINLATREPTSRNGHYHGPPESPAGLLTTDLRDWHDATGRPGTRPLRPMSSRSRHLVRGYNRALRSDC